MIYPDDFEIRIGFDKIRESISKLLSTHTAREILDSVAFCADFAQVKHALELTNEMRTIVMMEGEFPQTGFRDINHFLGRVRIEGTFLETQHLTELLAALELLDNLTRFFRLRAESDPYPLLARMTAPIHSYDHITSEIMRIVDKFGRIKDNASPELHATRRSLAEKSSQISRRLQQILRQAQADGYADEDSSVTIRDGRAVIPVSAANKRKVRGFVHSESATGRTAFIEPIEVVELNNEVKELEAAEQYEIVRILTRFTDSLRPHIDDLMEAGEYIAMVDFVLAKAKYAIASEAVLPILNSAPGLMLRRGRHPLLERALRREGREIVPLDLRLTSEKRILLISGPNAGGKSVCLKTVGLLQYMLQCGLLVPCLENSEFGIYGGIFIDIGDQQSLDNDLSTYSSHLINMKNVLRSANDTSLILIDEFGSGTEPTTGGAIAESVLQKLEERGAFGVITTHYANLKYYAAGSKGIENGAMTFDLQNIRPLFRLEMGRAGSSFAFEIARKIGMPEEIITMAMQKIGVEQISIERQLKDAVRDKRYWENKRDSIRQQSRKIEQTAAEYEMELSEIQRERNRLIKEAKEEAKRLLADANRQIENTIREIKESKAERDKTRQARESFNTFREALTGEKIEDSDPIAQKIKRLREKEQRRRERRADKANSVTEVATSRPTTTEEIVKSRDIEVGFKVRLDGQSTIGEVLSIMGAKAAVAFGQITTSVELSRLTIVPHAEFRKQKRQNQIATPGNYDTMKQRLDFREQLDVRGMRTVEALAAVQQFVDEAVMLGFGQISILHGKGTGALKQEIRACLSSQPIVRSVKDEQEEFGGAGISVVKFDL